MGRFIYSQKLRAQKGMARRMTCPNCRQRVAIRKRRKRGLGGRMIIEQTLILHDLPDKREYCPGSDTKYS